MGSCTVDRVSEAGKSNRRTVTVSCLPGYEG